MLTSSPRSVFQLLGAAIFVSTAESTFNNKMLAGLKIHVPTVDPRQVIAAGATGLRGLFGSAELEGIVASYMLGLRATFLLAVALAGCAGIVSFFAPRVSIKGRGQHGSV